ncbi:MAG TPA: S8 family peptidase [Clostridia bacterium]|jgi:serine protease AprX|nr:S8 family peptidase [Clostridiaceae bacterium]HOF27225.1 S8 family peptidase [Clostridia bacterium]HOM34705.1 S8 family peptidase [Clostridia bacterium]HOR90316.1 S8 family peptidase [Clostridia bacterium]HOT70242.1 S8 family peptidase [Clostridia bacterium]
MNEILQLKGRFEQKDSGNRPGHSNIPKNKEVKVSRLIDLKNDLVKVREFWEKESLRIKPLVSVYYTCVVAKSNRMKGILESGSRKNNQSIVGAKFSFDGSPKHIITHCVSDKTLIDAINNLKRVIKIVEETFGEEITYDKIDDINRDKYKSIFRSRDAAGLSKTRLVNTIVDAYYIENFGIERDTSDLQDDAIITIYDTGTKTSDILKQVGIDLLDVRIIDETTILLKPDQYRLLKEKAPYLISMAVTDISKLEKVDMSSTYETSTLIPHPGNEPTIGVIDTMFDENVYFSEWVEFKNMLDSNIPLEGKDYDHGTMVSSIIVDGAGINPDLDDGCGRFKVRHFGVSKGGQFSSFTILRAIKEIVATNRDIKVWNLSLGSAMEINANFISPEAAILDKIQYENDVIFVVAGTNKPKDSNLKKIGAPADSINSLVVNSVSFDDEPAEYSREGLVLSFFNKPDVSYYGGAGEKGIRVCSPYGAKTVYGTSFAAPWITRKVAFLIEVLGFTRELAKALIIDSAARWDSKPYSSTLIGYGIVPIHIDDIVMTPGDEIKFTIDGISEKYDTYNYNIPVPEDRGKQPFVSKATLCYFPNCSRNQGVDYTNTEMDIHFGRLIKTKKGKIKIDSINDNKQSDEENLLLYEGTVRELFRKWDNVKHIRENVKTPTGRQKKPKEKLENGLWGISIKTKERLNTEDGENLKFGLVVTLKEINGVNRIQEFIQQCQFRGWLVNRVNIENRIEIYNRAEETIHFD